MVHVLQAAYARFGAQSSVTFRVGFNLRQRGLRSQAPSSTERPGTLVILLPVQPFQGWPLGGVYPG